MTDPTPAQTPSTRSDRYQASGSVLASQPPEAAIIASIPSMNGVAQVKIA